jgi:hypothetical protein
MARVRRLAAAKESGQSKREPFMVKYILLAGSVAALISTSCLASAGGGVMTSPDKTMTYSLRHSGPVIPYYVEHKKAPVIFSNLATKYPKSLYYAPDGLTISGPNTITGTIETAVAFTPAANATVSEIDAAVGNISGTNGVLISVYSDASNSPGASLGDFSVSGLPVFGSCCELAIAKVKKGVKLTAGTQYWLVFSTSNKQSNAFDAVSPQEIDQLDTYSEAGNFGNGWLQTYTSAVAPAFTIYGN